MPLPITGYREWMNEINLAVNPANTTEAQRYHTANV